MTILIYGATGGIGQSLARKLAAQGHRLHLTARDESKLEALGRELGAGVTPGDVLDATAHPRIAQAAGAITGLAYCVGSITLKPAHRITPEDALADFRLNALGALQAVQAALPQLKRQGGSVLLFSTVALAQGFPNHASIAMAKGAVEGLVVSLAAELAPHIRVNAIAPSILQTSLSAGLIGQPRVAEALAGLHPLQRLGESEDVAGLAALLLSPDSGWITGQIIGVDGGRARLRPKG